MLADVVLVDRTIQDIVLLTQSRKTSIVVRLLLQDVVQEPLHRHITSDDLLTDLLTCLLNVLLFLDDLAADNIGSWPTADVI